MQLALPAPAETQFVVDWCEGTVCFGANLGMYVCGHQVWEWDLVTMTFVLMQFVCVPLFFIE